jgi:hypothetical protein
MDKRFEKVVQKHVGERGPLNASQFGFRESHSMTLQCMRLTDHVTLNFNNNNNNNNGSTTAVFLDESYNYFVHVYGGSRENCLSSLIGGKFLSSNAIIFFRFFTTELAEKRERDLRQLYFNKYYACQLFQIEGRQICLVIEGLFGGYY